jgi:hypothetical protein
MALLQALGLRRSISWDPPTLIDHLLSSPLLWLLSLLYRLSLLLRSRPPPFLRRAGGPVAGSPPIRVVCLSDTHSLHAKVSVPDGDLLIHAGDLTDSGTAADIQDALDWLAAQPHRHKIVVAGNHDSWFDARSRTAEDRKTGAQVDLRGLRYLQRSSVELEFDGGRTLVVYGAPDVPSLGGSEHA